MGAAMKESARIPLQFYATAPYPCSYLPGQTARSQVASPGEMVDNEVYGLLLERGFRRSGLFTYRPHCDACHACETLRIPVHDFVPNRSQRRSWKAHQALHTRLLRPVLLPEHYALYQRYLRSRHANGGMDNDNPSDYEQFLLRSRVETRLLEFRLPPDAPSATGDLRMVSVVDIVDHGISAVYTFYDDRAASGLGTYSILWLIEWARQLGLPYVYLGYWIAASAKMAYKAQFLPHEVLRQGQWHRVSKPAARR